MFREALISNLKAENLIEKKKVCMVESDAVKKLMTKSKGKANSIKDIVFHEYDSMGTDLRLLILTDYIRKEYEKYIGVMDTDITALGVLSFFEMLRRESIILKKDIKLGILCGTMVVIPARACYSGMGR